MHLLPSMMPEFDPQESWSDSSYELSSEHKNTQKKKNTFLSLGEKKGSTLGLNCKPRNLGRHM